ncbi:mitochondrial ribosomal protein subunit L20-domain-containing protein [Neurospora tetraspora]|uniref:Mitochondrial ribosomal protein subunit L20-domain-containing protein n=1 Tax=Neurospora tetraspora TaxID=94610 RepID=A0AAE0MVH8_9PEZI|nr:mitochondrial ribosomal protein subunit L20-domain-containing protein [Neurospora tetraspora]
MEASLSLFRPAATCCRRVALSSSTTQKAAAAHPAVAAGISVRYQSTANRTKRMLNIPPHESFLNVPVEGDRIIFNPPSSEASVYHTPFKFLPRSDPRRRANIYKLFKPQAPTPVEEATDANAAEHGEQLPPVLYNPTKSYNVTAEQVEEIRQLRAKDPKKYSVTYLSNKYNCTKVFIMMCTQAPREHQEQHKLARARIAESWGPRRAAAKLDARRRKEMLHRGEI